MYLNKVTVIGDVVADPELRFAGASQRPVTDIRLAVKRVWKDSSGERREETLFIDVVAWGKQAETAVQYLRKGREVAVDGRLTKDEWTDAAGKACSKVKIVSDRLIFLPMRSEEDVAIADAGF